MTPTTPTPMHDGSYNYQSLKADVHQELLSNRLNLERLTRVKREDAEPEVRRVIGSIVEGFTRTTPLSLMERESLAGDVLNELFGLGPLEALLKDPSVSDILVNRFDQVFVEREGRLEETDIVVQGRAPPDADHRAHRQHGRPPHRRVHARWWTRACRTAPASTRSFRRWRSTAPALSIRRFRTDRLGAQDLVERESLTQPMLDFLKAAVGCRLNVIVSGGTGAGKTTLLNILSSFIGAQRARRDHRGRGGVEAAPAARGAARDAAGQHRRQGRGAPARADGQRPAYAARPHHRRRGPQRGSAGHAAGDEHGPRRQLDDRPRQQRRATRSIASTRWWRWPTSTSRNGRSGSRLPRPST